MELEAVDVEVEIRERCASDSAELAARARLLKASVLEHTKSAFLLFLFDEVSLQVCVLCGAILFIFFGVSALKCVVVAPFTAFLVWASVYFAHYADAENKQQRQHHELFGWVAVAREPLLVYPGTKLCVILNQGSDKHVKGETVTVSVPEKTVPTRHKVVGTVSVEESREPLRTGWLMAIAVDPQYRRQGIGRALVLAACAGAASRGLLALEAATSEVQLEARALLHSMGWETRAAYHRKLCGGKYTLALTHMFHDLQAA